MMSRRDRVVRARTAPDMTMPGQRSQRVFTWVSMPEANSCTMCAAIPRNEQETSEQCLVLFEADLCSNSDRCSCRVRFNRIDRWSTASDLTERDRWTECSWSERLPV